MKIIRVQHHILRDCRSDFRLSDLGGGIGPDRPDLYENYVAFVCLLPDPDAGDLYCGLTAFNGDILATFDPKNGSFRSMKYREIAEPFEVKVHRSLEMTADGTVYGASACLYSADRRREAPGGSLFRIDPGSGKVEKFAIPVARDYIQTISLDDQRGLIYGQTYPVFKFFVHHIASGKTEDFDYIGSITHISAIDDSGCFWGTWDQRRHNLFKYDPETGEITWFRHGIPNARADANRMYPGAGPVDVMINGGDGYLYIGSCGGNLFRLDPATADVTYLGKPAPTARLPGLRVWTEDRLIGAAGDEEGGMLFTYDRKTGAFQDLGPIVDSATGLKLYRVHDLAVWDENTIFVGETDVPDRSGYLWECSLADG